MATINLGRIKPVFKGAYASGTAYVVDDIVVYSDESYICIQAGTGQTPSSATAYWTKMAAKGTDGTNVATTLTTQGDILYRDGSGLARLGYGTAGQVLQTGGSGANPSWGTVSSDFVKLSTTTISSATTNVDIDNVFNQSGYNCFKIFINKFRCSTADALYFRFLDNNGSQYSAGNYRWGVTGQEASSGGTNDGQQGYDWNSTNVKVAGTGGHLSTDTNNKGTFILEMIVSNPYQSGKTGFHWLNGYLRNTGDNQMSMRGSGHLNDSTVLRGIRFTMGSGNIEEGIFTVYGIK